MQKVTVIWLYASHAYLFTQADVDATAQASEEEADEHAQKSQSIGKCTSHHTNRFLLGLPLLLAWYYQIYSQMWLW